MSSEDNKNIKIFAPAKINLFLHVTGKRANGYHDLQSLVAFADFGDEVEITPTEKFSFTIHNAPILLGNDNNLVTHAARTLARALNKKLNLAISLTKNIPMGAGLGGGSADAAATIKGLLEYWNATLPVDTLKDILISLGADVPVCYHAHACYFKGVGEILTPLYHPFPTLNAVLVYPSAHCDTAEIFKNFGAEVSPAIGLPTSFQNEGELFDFLEHQKNDLTTPALQKIPTIKEVLALLEQQENCVLSRMSGSGSCCFALFKTKDAANVAEINIQNQKPSWWVRRVILQ